MVLEALKKIIKITIDYPVDDIDKAQKKADDMFEGKLSMYMRYLLKKELEKK